ncbi:MAG: hypothetical protein ACMG6S_21945, partial [Byssovorax sp.]
MVLAGGVAHGQTDTTSDGVSAQDTLLELIMKSLATFAIGSLMVALATSLGVAACHPASAVIPSASSRAQRSEGAASAVIPSAPSRPQLSDEWVARTILVQPTYRRVLLVDASAAPPREIRAPRLDLNARGAPAASAIRAVDSVFTTLEEAASAAHGGDLVAVSP